MLNVLDLYAGCGGLSLGLAEAGMKVRWANECWNEAASTYKSVHPTTDVYASTASDFWRTVETGESTISNASDVDLIVGGAPCQGFSGFNRHRGIEDPRNSEVEIFLRFVDLLLPDRVLLENVPGILTLDDGKVGELILRALNEMGYECSIGLLQAGQYGLPQNRWRVFFYATKIDNDRFEFPIPSHHFDRIGVHAKQSIKVQYISSSDIEHFCADRAPAVTVWDAIGDLHFEQQVNVPTPQDYQVDAFSDFQIRARKGSQKITDHHWPKVKSITQTRIDALPLKKSAGWCDLPEELKPRNLLRHGDGRYPNRFGRLEPDGIFNTILGRPHPYWGRVIHPHARRLISVRESARAQGFCDRVQFSGSASHQYQQIGNAVPPLLAEAIGHAIITSAQNG